MLADLDLAENRMPGDVDLVPLALEAAQGSLGHFAQIAERRRPGHQGMDLLLGGRSGWHRGQDEFQLLDEDTFGLQELVVIVLAEFLGSREVDEAVELFPAFNVIFYLLDELVQFFAGHRRVRNWFQVVGSIGVWGERNMIAPPLKSRAVSFKLA